MSKQIAQCHAIEAQFISSKSHTRPTQIVGSKTGNEGPTARGEEAASVEVAGLTPQRSWGGIGGTSWRTKDHDDSGFSPASKLPCLEFDVSRWGAGTAKKPSVQEAEEERYTPRNKVNRDSIHQEAQGTGVCIY